MAAGLLGLLGFLGAGHAALDPSPRRRPRLPRLPLRPPRPDDARGDGPGDPIQAPRHRPLVAKGASPPCPHALSSPPCPHALFSPPCPHALSSPPCPHAPSTPPARPFPLRAEGAPIGLTAEQQPGPRRRLSRREGRPSEGAPKVREPPSNVAGTAEEVSAAAVFLLSEGAAYTSGATFLVDGPTGVVILPPWQRPSSGTRTPHSAPTGSRRLGTPKGKRPGHCAPSHCLGCSS